MSRSEERDLADQIQKRAQDETSRLYRRLLQLRYERYKEALVATNEDLTRGRAQEARDLQRLFERVELTNTD